MRNGDIFTKIQIRCLEASLCKNMDSYRTPQPTSMQCCGIHSQEIYLPNTSAPKVQGSLWKREQKNCKSQRIEEFSVRLCLLGMSEAPPINSHQHDCPSIIWRRTATIDMLLWTKESYGISVLDKQLQLRNAKSGRNSLPNLIANWLYNTKESALKIYI